MKTLKTLIENNLVTFIIVMTFIVPFTILIVVINLSI